MRQIQNIFVSILFTLCLPIYDGDMVDSSHIVGVPDNRRESKISEGFPMQLPYLWISFAQKHVLIKLNTHDPFIQQRLPVGHQSRLGKVFR